MTIEYLGTPVFFTTAGTGSPMVFLHGFLETGKIWEPFLNELTAKRQVICIDLPGHGRSGNFNDVHPMELMADVVNAVLEHLDIHKATFVGHSMGGYVALAFTEKYSQKIAGLVLINSTPEADTEDRKTIRDRAAELVKRNKNAYINLAINNLVAPGNEIKFRPEIEEIKQEAFNLSEKGIIAAIKGMKIRTERINELKLLTTYKIMIAGKADPIIPLQSVEKISILTKCKLFPIEGGHLSYIECFPDVRKILHFID